MDNITKQQAVEIIKNAFELKEFSEREEGKSFYGKDGETVSFFFDKRQYDRYTVIEKLKECFKNKNIVEGQCRIENMTFLWTVAHVENRTKIQSE
nr:MAG TPA_asm: hypothetical protein [Caudoviricetes sp.]